MQAAWGVLTVFCGQDKAENRPDKVAGGKQVARMPLQI